jgi:hypothetical protein
LSIEPAAISEVAYKIIRADLQAARELYRILVAVALAMVCVTAIERTLPKAAPGSPPS